MMVDPSAIPAVSELLSVGEADDVGVTGLEGAVRLGLFARRTSADDGVACAGLVKLAAQLPNHDETIAAVFTCQPELRSAWLRIVAARLREAGKRRDAAELCRAIDLLDVASRRIREEMANASLQPTGYQALETALFGAPAEQAVVWPKLLRAIGATAELVEGGHGHPAPPLKPIEPLDTRTNWCAGRLLQLPYVGQAFRPDGDGSTQITSQAGKPGLRNAGQANEPRFVLSGECDEGEGPLGAQTALTPALSRRERETSRMRWVLGRPWVLLLAQVVFTQEAWEAEQISGRLALELADDQMSNPYLPGRVDVVVTTAEGDEVVCGTLAQLAVRVLARLDMTLLARPEQVARLDEFLAPVVRLLLERKVWRFEPRASGGRRPGYVIDDDFSTSCYRAFGSKHFYRGASLLSGAIRIACERWAKERLAISGSAATVGGEAALK